MKNTYKVIIGIVIVVAIALSFSMKQAQPTNTSIGAVLPLTGGLASVGEDIKNGMTLAMEETGTKVSFQDGAADPQKSLSAGRQLADIDKTAVIITAFRGATLSIASGLRDSNTVIVATTATEEGKSVSTSTPNLFVFGPEIIKSAEVLGQYAADKNICSKVALVSEQSDVGKDKLTGFSSKVGPEKVVMSEFFVPTATDFRTLIAKMKENKADCLFVEIKSNSLPVMLKQIEESKYYPKIFSTSYSVTPGVFKDSPSAQLSNLTFSSTLVDEKNPLTKAYLDKYQAKFGEGATDWSALGYEMVKMASAAIKECKSDSACIKSALSKINNLDTVLGRVSMEANREIQLKEYRIFGISDGHFVPLN